LRRCLELPTIRCSNRSEGAYLKLDGVDRRLIANLKLDGRMSYAELATRVGVSEGTARNRLTRLITRGVVRIAPVVEPEPIGYRLNVWFGIRCRPGAVREVAASLREWHAVRYVGICSGTYDLICEAIFLSEAELLAFLAEDLGGVEGIAHVDTSTVLDIAKFGYEWELREEDVLPRTSAGSV
jgi:Lrp/AsnC family transcriptional regulator, regulator for asnA, asnC and gidA